jgi:MFS family permease
MSDAVSRETGPAETASAERDLRFNFVLLLAHGFLGQTGMRLLQAPTFLPHFVHVIAGNATAVALVRAFQGLGMMLSPIVSASIVERRSRSKGLGLLFGSVMRLQVLLLALIALFVPTENALPLIWLVLGVFGLALGMQGVVFNFLISKTVPVNRRGVLLGLRTTAAGVLLVAVSYVGGWLVDRAGFPYGYGWTFLLCFVLTSLGLIAFGFLREPDSVEVRDGSIRFRERLGELPELLRAEPGFRRFLVARLAGTLARGVLPIYIVFIGQRLEIGGLAELGTFTAAFVAANSFSGLGWGLLADRVGFKGVFQRALVCWAAANALILVVSPGTLAYAAVYALVGAGLAGFMLAGQNLVLEFGSQRDRPMRIAISNTGSELFGMAGFLIAGLLADRAGAPVVFALSIACQLAALLVMRGVEEPRRRIEPTVEL